MDPAAIDDHDDLLPDCAEGGHHVMHILASLLGIKVGHDCIKDFGGAVLDGPNDPEQHTAGETAPGAMADPRLAFEGLLAFDLTLAQRTRREARTLRCAPPARPEHGKAPQDRFVFIEQNDCATARLGLERSECERAVGEISRGGSQATGGAVVAYLFFFNVQRTLSRPSGTPVCWANTVASARQLHWEEIEPCWRGSWSTRRLRCCSNSQVILGGRPERGRSTSPCVPWWAKRWTHLRRAEYVNWSVSETVCRRWPLTTARTAWARRKRRAFLVCCKNVSKVGKASSGKCSLRVRI